MISREWLVVNIGKGLGYAETVDSGQYSDLVHCQQISQGYRVLWLWTFFAAGARAHSRKDM
jgi:hypothetical protein